jgi:hypothetical protein
MLRRGSECLVSKLQILFRTSLPKVTGKGSWPFDTFIKQKWKNTMPFGGTLLVFKPVCRNSSEIYHYLLISFGKTLVWYTHKTSGFKTSGFKTSGFKTSGFKTSGLQNVRFTQRQVSKRPVSKRQVSKRP